MAVYTTSANSTEIIDLVSSGRITVAEAARLLHISELDATYSILQRLSPLSKKKIEVKSQGLHEEQLMNDHAAG